MHTSLLLRASRTALFALPALAAAASVNWTGGGGTWDTVMPNWDGGVWTNANNDTAVFGGTAGTVTLDGAGITAGGLTFTFAGYTLNGGPLHFGTAGTIDTSALGTTANGAKTTIASALTGSAGLTVVSNSAPANTGSLGGVYFSGDNTGLSGGIAVTSGMVNFASQASAGTGTLTLNGGGILAVNAAGSAGQTLGLSNDIVLGASGGAIRTTYTGVLTLSGAISGAGGLAKWDGGTLLLTNTNTYTGATTINAGVLRLGTGASLASAGSVVFGSGTGPVFDIGSNAQTLANLSFTANTTANVTGTGTLTLTGANAFSPFAYSNAAASTLNMGGLNAFVYGTPGSGTAANFTVGAAGGGSTYNLTSTVTLAGGSNVISTGTGGIFTVGSTGTGGNTSDVRPYKTSLLYLGAANTINANSLQIGMASAGGFMAFSSALTGGTNMLKIRGADGVSAAANVTLAGGSSNYAIGVGVIDLVGSGYTAPSPATVSFAGTGVAGSLDALIGTLTIGQTNGT